MHQIFGGRWGRAVQRQEGRKSPWTGCAGLSRQIHRAARKFPSILCPYCCRSIRCKASNVRDFTAKFARKFCRKLTENPSWEGQIDPTDPRKTAARGPRQGFTAVTRKELRPSPAKSYGGDPQGVTAVIRKDSRWGPPCYYVRNRRAIVAPFLKPKAIRQLGTTSGS